MGQAKTASFRLQVVQEQKDEGLSYSQLSKRHSVSYNTVKSICTLYALHGQSSLLPDYSACGRPLAGGSEKGYRLVRLLKHLHPAWGIPYITSRVREGFPGLALLSDRHYQRRLKAASGGIVLPPPKLPKPPPGGSTRLPHDEWQVDAKERIKLGDGTEACYLNVTDKKSNAVLGARVFPPGANLSRGHGSGQAGHARVVR